MIRLPVYCKNQPSTVKTFALTDDVSDPNSVPFFLIEVESLAHVCRCNRSETFHIMTDGDKMWQAIVHIKSDYYMNACFGLNRGVKRLIRAALGKLL